MFFGKNWINYFELLWNPKKVMFSIRTKLAVSTIESAHQRLNNLFFTSWTTNVNHWSILQWMSTHFAFSLISLILKYTAKLFLYSRRCINRQCNHKFKFIFPHRTLQNKLNICSWIIYFYDAFITYTLHFCVQEYTFLLVFLFVFWVYEVLYK